MDLAQLKYELSIVESKIEKIESVDRNSYSAQMSRTFHLGMVGGSGNGKNIHKLNEKREKDMNRSIAQSKVICDLYDRQCFLIKQITEIESGAYDRKEKAKQNRSELLAQYWKSIKPGDEVTLFTGNTVTVKSIKGKTLTSTFANCKYSAVDIIGKEAAKLL